MDKCLQYLGASVVHMVELDLASASLGNTDRHALLLRGNFFKKHRMEACALQHVSITSICHDAYMFLCLFL
jgi:hypothetical protein